jgi:hypothetical protein
MQHSEHADAFNAAVTNAGGQAFTDPTPALAPAVQDMFAKVDSIPKLAMLALTLENTAAATYVKQMGELTSPEALSAVATIAPVERQHAAILLYILGDYPVPDTFVKTNKTETSLGAQTPRPSRAAAGAISRRPAPAARRPPGRPPGRLRSRSATSSSSPRTSRSLSVSRSR